MKVVSPSCAGVQSEATVDAGAAEPAQPVSSTATEAMDTSAVAARARVVRDMASCFLGSARVGFRVWIRVGQTAVRPPSIVRTDPVTKEEESEMR